MDLCKTSTVRALLEKYSLAPKKAFGQNFLINPAIPQTIAECSYDAACRSGSGQHAVLEIGPGVGALTVCLSDIFDRVVAVEIDRGLIPLLGEVLAGRDNAEVIEGDIMNLSVPELIRDKFGDILDAGGTLNVCANLPYYITSPVIMKLLEAYPLTCRPPYSALTFMIQLEVAERLAASPGTSEYGAITAAVALRADVKREFTVSAGNFYPAPKVSSSVVSLLPHGGICDVYPDVAGSRIKPDELGSRTAAVITAAFAKRRKTLVNALSEMYPKSAVTVALDRCGLRTDIRGERLSAYDFCRLTDALASSQN